MAYSNYSQWKSPSLFEVALLCTGGVLTSFSKWMVDYLTARKWIDFIQHVRLLWIIGDVIDNRFKHILGLTWSFESSSVSQQVRHDYTAVLSIILLPKQSKDTS